MQYLCDTVCFDHINPKVAVIELAKCRQQLLQLPYSKWPYKTANVYKLKRTKCVGVRQRVSRLPHLRLRIARWLDLAIANEAVLGDCLVSGQLTLIDLFRHCSAVHADVLALHWLLFNLCSSVYDSALL